MFCRFGSTEFSELDLVQFDGLSQFNLCFAKVW